MKKVFTVGVFDYLHIGHVNLIKRAKEIGDYLTVAVQESDVVQQFKPDAELLYSTDERAFMVESLRYVDEVITYQSVDTIVPKIDFDVFAIGPDQNHDGFLKAVRWCREHGRDVVVIPRTEGISSSQLRNKDI
ncbi:MAG: adenylyltransferase/cytidyltransferase family protein [Bacteroidaceae bacterium]|nr:adenylyltransferase/cytidyltransferase family protein [Bacteroidaceae bacterium]MBR1801538.1 adenylyltransferase/cytidyltransferase family protein [Bacteroidaceae bacterium]